MSIGTRAVLAITTGLFACAASAAFAANVSRGATYRGTLSAPQTTVRISFRVSAGGTTVEDVRLSKLPIYCTGSLPPNTKITFKPATISRAGAFSTPGRDVVAVGPLKGTVAATLTLTGTFVSAGRERGVISTTFTGPAKSCSGRTAYRTATG